MMILLLFFVVGASADPPPPNIVVILAGACYSFIISYLITQVTKRIHPSQSITHRPNTSIHRNQPPIHRSIDSSLDIHTDAWRYSAFSGAPTADSLAHTPRLDAFRHEAVDFSRAYAAYPLCTPSRCSIQSGLMPCVVLAS